MGRQSRRHKGLAFPRGLSQAAGRSPKNTEQQSRQAFRGRNDRIMSDISLPRGATRPGLFDRDRIVAGAGFNRWLVPPCALAIHLSIGMAYGFSVFWLPMTRLIPGAASCAAQGFQAELVSTSCNWSVPAVNVIFEIFIAVLGISAPSGAAGWNTRGRARPA
jgi:hypothetical protein